MECQEEGSAGACALQDGMQSGNITCRSSARDGDQLDKSLEAVCAKSPALSV
jgi:hypothetical protein